MPRQILGTDVVARIARRHGFVTESAPVEQCWCQAEYLHGLPGGGDDRTPARPWAVDPSTGRLSAELLLDGFLREINVALSGDGLAPEARLH